jgi:hypothetical protein
MSTAARQITVRSTLLAAALLASPAHANPDDGLTETIPPRIVHAATGCWQVRDGYRITFEPAGQGLRARQEFSLRSPMVTAVRYLPSSNEFGTQRIDSHHGGSVAFRLVAGGMEVSWYGNYSHLSTPWARIRRCGSR